jgi:nitrogen regulatory protein P-II 1
MYEIKAIIQPFMLENVLRALAAIDELPGLTVSQVLGWGQSRAAGAADTVLEGGHAFVRMTKLEVVVRDELADQVVTALVQAARTGRAGDGKVFVHEVERAIRVRTGEEGDHVV